MYMSFTIEFQSTLSVRRATNSERNVPTLVRFQSTLSVRRATQGWSALYSFNVFQSTLSVRRATDTKTTAMRAILISIHALRKESDRISRSSASTLSYFNPRSP